MLKLPTKLQMQLSLLQDDLADFIGQCEEYFDDRTEKWQESDAGQAWQEKIQNLNEAHENIDDARAAFLAFTGED